MKARRFTEIVPWKKKKTVNSTAEISAHMNILIVASMALFKNTRYGGAKRLYLFVNELAKQHDLSVLMFDGSQETDRNTFFSTQNVFANVIYLPFYRDSSSVGKLIHIPVDITHIYKTHAVEINKFIQGKTFNAVMIFFPLALSLYCIIKKKIQCERTSFLYLEDDLYFEKVRQEKNNQSSPRGWLWKHYRYIQTLLFYRRCLKNASSFLTISEEEKKAVGKTFPWCKTAMVRYGIPLEEYTQIVERPQTVVLGFIGNFYHVPNNEAVLYFLGVILPQLLNENPDYTIHIAGKNIPEETVKNHRNPAIRFKENISDLSEFYRDISIFVNPIVSGKGMRTKLIEAAAFGRPIISSRLGAEGADHLIIEIAETVEEYMNAIRKLQDAAYYQTIVKINRESVEQVYSIQKQADILLQNI
jgi:glycosyltransferase involved in cell wall biosynthesis